MKKKAIKGLAVVLGLSAIMTVGGMSAYFTDKDQQTNVFTTGKIDIDLTEPEWDKYPDQDNNNVPDPAEDLTPNKTIKKDPMITNVGINDAFVFATVEVPCKNIITANADGTRKPAALVDLYSYTVNPGWVKMGTYDVRDGSGVIAHRYLYAYAAGNVCTAVEAGKATTSIFSNITTVNAIEGQGLEEQKFQMPIKAYGIQVSDLNGGKTAPADVWSIFAKQNSIAEEYK